MVQKFQKTNKDKVNNEFKEIPKVGDTVYYVSPTHKKYVKKSEVIEQRKSKRFPFRSSLFSVVLVMKNGDVVSSSGAFASKQEAVANLIERIISEINYEKIALANTQRRIESLEKKLKVLQKHG